jgi:ATP-dependent Clp protease ATP-binding subunit ClpC
MFERFTQNARSTVTSAQEQARSLGHHNIGTEHILLGVLAVRDESGDALAGLLPMVTAFGTRQRVVERIGENDTMSAVSAGHIPFTPRAKKVLELSLRQALRLGHPAIDIGHIVLALFDEEQGVAATILRDDFGLDFTEQSHQVISTIDITRHPAETWSAAPIPDEMRLLVNRLAQQVATLTEQVAELQRRLDEAG